MTIEDIQKDVLDWHKDTFPNATISAINAKVDEELVEFIEVISGSHTPEEYWDELSDVIITNIVFVDKTSEGQVSLADIVNRKLDILKSRVWGEEDCNGDRPRVRE